MILIIGANNRPPITDAYPTCDVIFNPEQGLNAPAQRNYAHEIYEEHPSAVVATGSQTILNVLDIAMMKDDSSARETAMFVWRERERRLVPLSECVHLPWAAHFALGDLYAYGEIDKPGECPP